jgi:RHS repeat-associated protein
MKKFYILVFALVAWSFIPSITQAMYLDDEDDLVYYGYRYYNPTHGKWISRDPAEEDQGGPNLYVFVENSPVNDFDFLGLLDVKFEVTHDNFFTGSWFGLGWGWGQPYWAAEGDYSIGANSASSFVKVYSSLHGNTCNTIPQGNAGTITLFLRECQTPGTYHVMIQADATLAGHGSAGHAIGAIYNAGPNTVLWSGYGTTKVPVYLNNQPFAFDVHVGPSWTKASYYVPTIAFVPGTYRPESSGASTAKINFMSATRTGN